jgi:hypothetical protein
MFSMDFSFPGFVNRLMAVALVLGWTACPGHAQKSYPGWSAPKVVPTTSSLVTYPDIAAVGDTIHVIFRATFESSGTAGGPTEQEVLLEAITRLDRLLRLGNKSLWEVAGGKERIKKQRAALMERLRKIQEKPNAGAATPPPPLQTSIYYTRSEDRGRTWWAKPIPIPTSPDAFLGQTALHVNEDGIHVVFTAAMGDNILHIYNTHSADGGKTWSRPAKVSDSIYKKFSPQVAPIPGKGMVVTWWELEETEVKAKERVDLGMMNQLLENPMIAVTKSTSVRATIHYARYLSGGWLGDQVLDTASGTLPYLNIAAGPKGEVYIHWVDSLGLACRLSRNGGVGWETSLDFAQVMNEKEFNSIQWGGGDYQFLRGNISPNKSGSLMHRKGLLGGQWKNIIDEQTQHSFPQTAYTKDEFQAVWGTTDLSGRHILYFREDNKAPTSEMVYPPIGDFAKYDLAFIWTATDDIATQLTYRFVPMKRENPKVRPKPANWSLYDAVNHFAMKAPEDGYYTLFVQATDFSGNEEKKPTAFDFQTYFVPPGVKYEVETLPPLTIHTRNIEIKWMAEDNGPSKTPPLIAYRLDGNPVTEFAPRTSIKIAGLTAGWHQVQLIAVDENGNASTFGDTVSVDVDIQLRVDWAQIPIQPREDNRVYVKEERVPLSWTVSENTEDRNISYQSVVQVVFNGKERPWSPPQFGLQSDIAGNTGGALEEGEYLVKVMAQDEYGNPAVNRISTQFTVDHTPPAVIFNQPTFNPETKIPTLSVAGQDNYSKPENLEYQFRIVDATEPSWSAWSKNSSLVCEGRPVKFYSWGFTVEARSRDVAGNVTAAPARFSLIWYERNPWMLYTLAGIAALLVLGIVFILVSSLVERARARKRTAARKAAAQKPGPEAAPAAAAAAREDDLFAAPGGATQPPTAAPAASSGFDWTPQQAGGFEDPFSSAVTQVFDDPFAETVRPPAPAPPPPAPAMEEEEPPMLEIGFGDESEEALDLFGEAPPTPPPPPPPAAPPVRDWSPDQKVELTDRDLFDPM